MSEQNVQVTQAVKDEMRRIASAMQPSDHDKEDFITYAKEIVRLRHRTRAEPDLVEVLRKCRDQFNFYVNAHMAKRPPDMDKAATNQEFVELCDAALRVA